jgi:hypothetical protein
MQKNPTIAWSIKGSLYTMRPGNKTLYVVHQPRRKSHPYSLRTPFMLVAISTNAEKSPVHPSQLEKVTRNPLWSTG